MASISSCAKADEADLVGHLSPIIGVGDEEDTVAELIEWPRLKGSHVEYPTGSSRFKEFFKAKSSIDGIWGHTFEYRGNFFRTCSVSQGRDYLYLLPNLAKEKKCRRLGDEVSLEYVQGVVKDSRTDGFYCYLTQFDYGLTLPLSNLAKSVMNMIGDCPAQLNFNFWEVILVCETLNERWAASGSEKRITAKDFLEYYAVKYVTAIDGAYLSSSSSRPCFFDLSSARRVWNDNLLWVPGEYLQRSDEEPQEVNNRTITKVDLYLRFKRVASKDDKLAQLNKMPDGLVNMASVSNIVVRNLAKRKAVKRGAASRSVISDSVDDSSKKRKVETGLLEEQCRAKAREKMVAVRDDEFKKDRSIELEKRISQLEGEKNQLEDNLTRERKAFQLELEKVREAVALKLKEVRAESVAEAERLVTASTTSQNNLGGKLYQVRYINAEIMAFSEGNYEEKEIMNEEEVEEMEDGLNVAEKTVVDNQEIESSRLRVLDLEGLLEVEKKSSAKLMFVYVHYVLRPKLVLVEEYEALISQYEDRLDENVKLSLKLEEAKRQIEDKTAKILSRDLALNQLTSELVELKEKAASGSQHEAELAEYCIRALNEEISDMKCNIRALNEQLLKRDIDLDTARTNLAVSEANFEKLSYSIVGKYRELRNSAQIHDSLIVRDGEIASGERSREMNEFLHRKEELVENMRINLTNSRQKLIDLTKQMSERIDQLTTELGESKSRRLKDNKRVAVTH
ncbi:hypothetical protein GIB67_011213 [Kingdonia uniflora]|uniref:Uncharacterized protein n=1 Tax=Kingdonia uniflora TaxID=39325 RepID=A0A7J7M4A0_9MAGN|nr:hypothetical protein GIB67_011213 [Kingdonia uniflora]